MNDDVTITDLYEQLESVLHRYALRLARDADRADDLVQETFIRAMAHLQLLRQLAHPQRRAWLYRVMRNLFIDEQRARQRQQALVEQLAWDARLSSYPIPGIVSWELLDAIPERYSEVLERRYLLGMTSREIGQDLGIPAATVRSRLRLATKWLRKHRSELL